jgi:putative inorganic carbon (HCO3(-)) transporter
VARIDTERGWGQWAIVGWTVARETVGGSSWVPGVLGLAALVILMATVVTSWPKRNLLLGYWGMLVGRYRALDERWTLVITGGAAVLVYAVTGTVPTLAALGLLTFLLLLQPQAGLPLVALALPFYQPGVALLGRVFSMVEILILLTALGWVVDWIASRDPKVLRPTGIDWGVIGLVVVGLLSLAWAEHRHVAAREFRTVILEAAIFYGLMRAMARDRRDVWRIADAWVLGGTAIAVVGVCQWAFGQNLITAEGVWRVRGFYGSPNNLALYLGRVFPLALAVAAFAAAPSTEGVRWSGAGRRCAYAVAALIMVTALFLTYSRGAWLLGVPASLLFLAAMRGRRTFAVTAGVLVILALVGALVVGTGRLTALMDTTEGTTFFRLQLWQSSWAMIVDHPVLGVGLDNFLYHYRTYYVLPTAWEEFNLSHPHNLVLDYWLRLGLMGLGLLLWLVATFFRKAWQCYRRLPEGYDRLLVLGLMGGMVNFVAHGLVDNAFFLVDLACVFVIMLALVQVRWPGARDQVC